MKNDLLLLLFAVGLLIGLGVWGALGTPAPPALPALLIYSFNTPGLLSEAGSMKESSSPYFWLNSGGEMLIQGSSGMTMQGDAAAGDKWRKEYAADNPTDTDEGLHPQNVFRLVTKSLWQNVSQEAGFLVVRDNISQSPNRNASNGLLLMNRYADNGQTLYYAGVRVDGTAVIKKKYKGTYYTMAQEAAFPGSYSGSRDNKNLIPHNEWISLKTEVVTNADNSVTVTLYMKRASDKAWTKLLEAADSGQYENTPPITAAGYEGIRTDFMDVQFKSYRLTKL